MTEHEKKLLAMNEEIMRVKESHGIGDNDDLGYDGLCVHPGVDLPEGYKVPKFEVFNYTRKQMVHLRRCCDQISG